jgi:serine/threonine protein kinase
MLTVIGTHFYQAPEVYIGGGYDERIDLWALGITIFKMLTGSTPFESEYHSSTIQNIIKCEPSFEGPAWSKYSNFAKDFVLRLLKKKEERMSLKEAMKHMWLS